jgi:hypothetical protein
VVNDAHHNSHIALVSDWDTLFGRSLPESMAQCLGEAPNSDCRRVEGRWLRSFKYLRGLDGQLPKVQGLVGRGGTGDGDDEHANNNLSKETEATTPFQRDPQRQDRAEGRSQFDYLRRLGDGMRRLDAELRQTEQRGIEAVGVIGYDQYDKLLILQELRPRLPDAVFFTTDLDALFLHQSAWTLPYVEL